MPTDITEVLKKVKHIEIVAKRAVNDIFAGQYQSTFRGQGMEFSEVRLYEPGDDIRLIDWNVTAREGRPYIKRYVEERELTVLFMVDISASGMFGTSRSKLEAALEVAATLMFSAIKNNDKVGLITFCDKVIDHYRPRKGKANILHLIRELLTCDPIRRPTDLEVSLDYVNRVQKRRAVIFLLSDFLCESFQSPGRGIFKKRMVKAKIPKQLQNEKRQILNRYVSDPINPEIHRAIRLCSLKHDLIALTLTDPREIDFPNVGFITFQDAETGEMIEVDTADEGVRLWLRDRFMASRARISGMLKKSNVDQVEIATASDGVANLKRFFQMREKRQ